MRGVKFIEDRIYCSEAFCELGFSAEGGDSRCERLPLIEKQEEVVK
jgi:hypothetical protein